MKISGGHLYQYDSEYDQNIRPLKYAFINKYKIQVKFSSRVCIRKMIPQSQSETNIVLTMNLCKFGQTQRKKAIDLHFHFLSNRSLIIQQSFQQAIDNTESQEINYIFNYGKTHLIKIQLKRFLLNAQQYLKEKIVTINTYLPNSTIDKLYVSMEVDSFLQRKQLEKQFQSIFLKTVKSILTQYRYISVFGFSNMNLTFLSIAQLSKSKWKFITILDLSHNRINFQGAKIISTIQLQYLKKINLSFNPIGNRGLKYLKKCHFPYLQKFDFREVKITYDCLTYLFRQGWQRLNFIALSFGPTNKLFSILQFLFTFDCQQIYVSNNGKLEQSNFDWDSAFVNKIVKSSDFTNTLISEMLSKKRNLSLIKEIRELLLKRVKVFYLSEQYAIW